MDQNSLGHLTPTSATMAARILWIGLMSGQVFFVLALQLGFPLTGEPVLPWTASLAPVALLPVFIGLSFFLRGQTYKANWQGLAVTPQGYLKATVVCGVILEIPSFIGLVGIMLHHDRNMGLIPVGVVLLLMALSFPDGKPMEPRGPVI